MTEWRKDPGFSEAIEKATAQRLLLRLERIEAGEQGWQGTAWALERLYPHRFARPEVNESNRCGKLRGQSFYRKGHCLAGGGVRCPYSPSRLSPVRSCSSSARYFQSPPLCMPLQCRNEISWIPSFSCLHDIRLIPLNPACGVIMTVPTR